MKHFFLLGAAALLAFNASAQSIQRTTHMPVDPTQLVPNSSQLPVDVQQPGPNLNNLLKTAATAFYTETFGSAATSGTGLPTGWTASGNSNYAATWKFRKTAVTGQYNVGTIASTTSGDGWMVYDSDSIGSIGAGTAVPIEGRLTSPTVSCSGHATVNLKFQQVFRRFQDSCFIEVSTNNFATFTRFPVLPNNTIASNDLAGPNPTLTQINISSVAANQANVKFRFYYIGLAAGGSYNWLVDDVTLSELDPVDVTIQSSSLIMRGTNRYSLFSNYPMSMVDSTFGLTFSSNVGSTAVTPSYNYNVRRGGTSVYSYTRQYAIPVNAVDSIIDFSEPFPGFVPNTMGTYTGAFSATITGDATPTNNVDTASFNITDSVLTVFTNPTSTTGGYYLHRPAAGTTAAATNYIGTQFEIAPGKQDTFTSASVAFSSNSAAGGSVSIQIYKLNAAGSGYDIVATTVSRPLTASMLSTTGNIVLAEFQIDRGAFPNGAILESGSYVAVVQANGIPAANQVVVLASRGLNSKSYGFTGYPGAVGTSNNDGAFDFSPSSIAVGITSSAILRVHFGRKPGVITPGAVTYTNANVTVAANPNPANGEFKVPVTLTNAADVNVLLTNPMGQVISAQQLGKVVAGQTATATFNTSGLANGIYFYTVEAGTERITNRVVVSH